MLRDEGMIGGSAEGRSTRRKGRMEHWRRDRKNEGRTRTTNTKEVYTETKDLTVVVSRSTTVLLLMIKRIGAKAVLNI
jgi:hypothetical protein